MNLDYLCGFIDGEGCISLTTTPLLQVAQANEQVLIQAQELTGIGAVYKLKDRAGRSPIWEWQANGTAVIELLEKIVDKLIVKRSQAEALINAKHLFPKQQQGRKLSEEIKQGRQELKQLLKTLKKTRSYAGLSVI